MANDVLIDMLASLSLDGGAVTSPADPGTTLLNDNTKSWAGDKFKRCMVRIVHGKGAGQQVRVTGNSASSLSVSPPWIEGLDSSSVYVIYQPEVSDQVDRILADVNAVLARLTLARSTLLDRLALLATGGNGELTLARVTNLDNLDAAISSRSVPGDAMALTAAERLIVQALVLSDATPFAGALIDAAVSSRAAPGDAMDLLAAAVTAIRQSVAGPGDPAGSIGRLLNDYLDATVSSRATQGQILSDATPFPGANVNAAISTRALEDGGRLQTVQGVIDAVRDALYLAGIAAYPAASPPVNGASLASVLRQVYDDMAATLVLYEIGGALVADGTEQNVIIDDAPAAVYTPLKALIDLTNMAPGDTAVIRWYYRIAGGGAYLKKGQVAYNDAQDPALVEVGLDPNRHGFKVTLQQTAGVNRSYTWEYFHEGPA